MQTVTLWERDGMPTAVRGNRGRPSLYDRTVVEGWLKDRDAARQSTENLSLQHERARKERAQALLAIQTYQTRAKELLPRSQVTFEGQAYTKAWTAKVRSLPRRMSQAGIITREQEGDVAALCREILDEIARWTTMGDLQVASAEVTTAS